MLIVLLKVNIALLLKHHYHHKFQDLRPPASVHLRIIPPQVPLESHRALLHFTPQCNHYHQSFLVNIINSKFKFLQLLIPSILIFWLIHSLFCFSFLKFVYAEQLISCSVEIQHRIFKVIHPLDVLMQNYSWLKLKNQWIKYSAFSFYVLINHPVYSSHRQSSLRHHLNFKKSKQVLTYH